jgi:2-keto-4-pentenoate hydratase
MSRETEACDLLYGLWRAGSVIGRLDAALAPRDRAEAYRMQQATLRHSLVPQAGWKIAATSKAGQAHINVAGPMAGTLLAERRLIDGGTAPLGANRMRVAEPEFAFRFDQDLPPRAAPYAQHEVMAAVASLHPAIEIPDSRYEPFTAVGAEQLIADNACAHLFVIGEATGADWRAVDLAGHGVRGRAGGGVWREGSGANVLGDPRLALVWLVNELSGHGLAVRAGEVVMTGTCMVPLAIGPECRVEADFGVFGAVSIVVAGEAADAA